MIRVLLVDDSPIVLHILQRLLAGSPDIQVVGTAADGKKALDLLPALSPDVICTDLHMPVMNGLELTQAIMMNQPLPILGVSASLEPGSPNIFRLLDAGAVDIFPKPRDFLGINEAKVAQELASKIRILAGVKVIRRVRATPLSPRPPSRQPSLGSHAPQEIVVIGASTGGPRALRQILAALPADFPVPVACVQHIGGDFMPDMLSWLGDASALRVCRALNGELPRAGCIHFAPPDVHLEIDGQGHFRFSSDLPVEGHRPSATVLMHTAALSLGQHVTGVLLTGMGRDGAEGMASIASAGGVTIAQDEATSVVWGMPGQAVALGAARFVLPIEQIASSLVALVTNSETSLSNHLNWNKAS